MTIRRILLALFLFCAFGQAHALRLQPLQGDPITLEQLKGKWVIINFWASWCGPCVDEINTLNAFYSAHHKDVSLFAVNMDEVAPAEQAQLAKEFHLTYPSLETNATRSSLGQEISAVPATFVFSPKGKMQEVRYGQLSPSSLASLIRQKNTNQLSSRE